MNSYRVNELDKIVRNSLQDALRSAEPSSDVWNRIKSNLELENTETHTKIGAFFANLLFRGMRLGDVFLSTPGWQAGMYEQQTDLFVRISVYPGANIIALGVV
ncbi:MAG: hypothetical protein JXA42_12280 [Anaerolineales bacterium]|nr:hypothetical protein [Anaerolineales bacterium]